MQKTLPFFLALVLLATLQRAARADPFQLFTGRADAHVVVTDLHTHAWFEVHDNDPGGRIVWEQCCRGQYFTSIVDRDTLLATTTPLAGVEYPDPYRTAVAVRQGLSIAVGPFQDGTTVLVEVGTGHVTVVDHQTWESVLALNETPSGYPYGGDQALGPGSDHAGDPSPSDYEGSGDPNSDGAEYE